jgi:hypothetical protein
MSNYQLPEADLWVPQARDLHIIIDDGGAPELDIQGYTSLSADEFTFDKLQSKVRDLCAKYRIMHLHAMKLVLEDAPIVDGEPQIDMAVYESVYRELFAFAIHELSRGNYYQRVFSFLTSQQMIQQVFEAHNKAFEKNESLPRGARLAERYRELYSHFAFPTIELLKRIKHIPNDMQIYIHIDRKDKFENLCREMTSLPGSTVDALLPVHDAMCAIFNSWKKVFLKINARVKQIHVASSLNSPIIGIVDAFSNFSLNFARVVLKGKHECTPTQILKYRIFRDILINMVGETTSSVDAVEEAIRKGFVLKDGRVMPLTDKPVSTFEIAVAP